MYTIDTEINRYVSIRSSCCTDTSGSIISHLTFIHLSKILEQFEFDLIYGTHYTGDHFALALVFVGFTVLVQFCVKYRYVFFFEKKGFFYFFKLT